MFAVDAVVVITNGAMYWGGGEGCGIILLLIYSPGFFLNSVIPCLAAVVNE